MRHHISAVALAATCLVAISLLPLSGCSSKGEVAEGRTKPEGRILENGLPIQVKADNLPPGDPGFQVTFISIGSVDAGKEAQARIINAEEGSFELVGADGMGIPPGKYRVAVLLAPEGGTDALDGKFSRENSKIEVEVKDGEDLVIDLANYK